MLRLLPLALLPLLAAPAQAETLYLRCEYPGRGKPGDRDYKTHHIADFTLHEAEGRGQMLWMSSGMIVPFDSVMFLTDSIVLQNKRKSVSPHVPDVHRTIKIDRVSGVVSDRREFVSPRPDVKKSWELIDWGTCTKTEATSGRKF